MFDFEERDWRGYHPTAGNMAALPHAISTLGSKPLRFDPHGPPAGVTVIFPLRDGSEWEALQEAAKMSETMAALKAGQLFLKEYRVIPASHVIY
jgi:hypothetical protein